ncbi:MAG: 2-oxoacid:acceptor oxidoreductase subunit alpha [Candidatus Hodarchaeales archaeon]|jgi:2-oxoglutarate ferredoxin oxidoreductase subunit alpha
MSQNSIRDISIVLCGAAGQGIATVERLLTKILKRCGLNVFSTSEFMSRVRGGTNSTTIRISSERVRAYCERMDILIPFTREAVPHVKNRLTPNTCIIGEKKVLGDDNVGECAVIDISFGKLAMEVGDRIYSNSIAIGLLAGLFRADRSIVSDIISERFVQKGEDVVNKNLKATYRGYDLANDLIENGEIPLDLNLQSNSEVTGEMLLDGRDAVALGAIAGGCNYVVFYPMAPSTGIGAFLARYRQEFGIVTDQSEDELSVINKAYGAWYAGARALVTTSGGGFALMTEGLSLIGITESPMVVHLGQRPGPATGMPTRTEQGDLELALYAGHGYFPRIILSPGSLTEAYALTQNAFNLADKFQVPVIVLTDHYFINSMYNVPTLPLDLQVEKSFVETRQDYKRYKFSENGISPRGIPGYGKGLVRVDSHTHTEEGAITEDPIIRTKSVDKRLNKLDLIQKNALPPKLKGEHDYKTLIIGWGSTYHIIDEAVKKISRRKNKIGFLHFNQVYPLHQSVSDYLRKADQTIIIENNPTSQFGKLMKLETGIAIDDAVLKYSGYPFSVEEILGHLNKLIGE